MDKIENLYTPNKIRTYTGKYINPSEPVVDLIDINDIAHALSQMPRFGGHLPKFYSVAQHCYECAIMAPEGLKMEALLHDASEAYLMDIPSPVKKQLTNYEEIETKLMEVIGLKYGFPFPLRPEIKLIDKVVLEREWNQLMLCKEPTVESQRILYWSNDTAKKRFLGLFEMLVNQAKRKGG
jgi:hypothetical protein